MHEKSLRDFLSSLTDAPGIYQMVNDQGVTLYIGKARHLKKRVSSYFQRTLTNKRIISLVSQIHHVDVIVTRNENEALLLENQLIKQYRPRYNILLRDDKSYPYIKLSLHRYPRLASERVHGRTPKNKAEWFGPYPNLIAVRETIKFMQKLFKLRTCQDKSFKQRSRPCLLYQLKKCTAPCVGYISEENYLEDVKNAKLLLQGKNQAVIEYLAARMEHASGEQDYELAASLRDQIAYLRHIQTQQIVTKLQGNIDVFAVVTHHGLIAVALLWIREGQLLGNRMFDVEIPVEHTPAEILSAFIPQYYAVGAPLVGAQTQNLPHTHGRPQGAPLQVIIKEKLPDKLWLEKALNIKLIQAKQGEKYQWICMAEKTGEEALKTQFSLQQHYLKRLEALQQLLHLPVLPARIVCFDISHTSGEAAVASCVTFDQSGPLKKAYRKYNIQAIQKGDDYAAMAQALERYLGNAQKQNALPDVMLIDGGKGQLKQAEMICEKLAIHTVKLLAVAKGVTRKPGLEQLFIPGQKTPLAVGPDSEVLHLIQQIRDEAHRFAVHSHRKKRAKNRLTSVLETIPGIGAKRRRQLLQQLGGLQEIKRADIAQLQKVPGISAALAEKIYHALRD